MELDVAPRRGTVRRVVLSLGPRITLSLMVLAAIPLLMLWYIEEQRLELNSMLIVQEAALYVDRTASIASDQMADVVDNAMQTLVQDQANYLRIWFEANPEIDMSDIEARGHVRSLAVQPFWGNGTTWLYSRSGEILFHHDLEFEGQTISDLARTCPGIAQVADVEAKGPMIGEVRIVDEPYLIATAPVWGTEYLVAAWLPRSQLEKAQEDVRSATMDFFTTVDKRILQATQKTRQRSTVFILVAFLAIGLFASILARSIVRPIRKLTTIVAEGSLDPLLLDQGLRRSSDEIGELARAFESMAEDLVRSRDKLIRREEALAKANTEIMRLNLDLEAKIQERTKRLEQALDELKSLDKSKDDFISLVSHEMRTPLTSISAYTEALLSGGVARTWEQQKKFLIIIKDESDRLSRLINDVLDLSRMEAKRMPFNFGEINLASLVEKAVLNHRKTAENRETSLSYQISLDRSELTKIWADYDRIMQVVTNLISNALKFTPEGGNVRVSLGVERKVDRHGHSKYMAKVTVADDGIGIPEVDKRMVFEKFGQVDSVDYHHEGSGLGLTIAKLIVEEHGGNIGFTSKLGEGSMFYFTLPLEREEDVEGQD